MKPLEMMYQRFDFVGMFNIMPEQPKKETINDKNGVKTTNYGFKTIKNGLNKNGNQYTSRAINCFIETDNGDREYLAIDDYVTLGVARTCMFRAKGSKETVRIDYALGKDPKTIEQCENFLVIKFECGDLKFETLDMGHLIDWIEEHRNELNGKRVHVSGNAQVSTYEGNLQIKYKPSNVRNAYENEVDDLKIDLNVVYTKGAIKSIPFSDVAQQEVKKIPISMLFPITVDSETKSIGLIKSGDEINLNVEMLDFSNPETENIYNYMTQLLNYRAIVDPTTKALTEVELEEFKYYVARFIGHIKSNKKDGDLKEEELTMQEKFYLQTQMKTLDDIKKERGIKRTSDKIIVVDAIPYNVDEVEVTQEQLNCEKKNAPTTVSAKVFTPPTTPTNGIPKVPSFTLGMKK